MVPDFSVASWSGILGTALIAVFAFIGFEHVVNIAEEIREPNKVLPRALFLTLGLTTLLYALVVFTAIAAVTPAELATSGAPLALAFERLTGQPLAVISSVAIVATLNGVVVHMIMIARVLYGLARNGDLPEALGHVSERTQIPLLATGLAILVILALALLFPLQVLAQYTAQGALVIFVFVNAALIRIKGRETAAPKGVFVVPIWVPCIALLSNLVLLVASSLS